MRQRHSYYMQQAYCLIHAVLVFMALLNYLRQ